MIPTNGMVDPATGRIPHVGNTADLRTATYKNGTGDKYHGARSNEFGFANDELVARK